MQISWKIEGEKELSRKLQGISDSVKDWKPAFTDATKELVRIFSTDVFATRGAVIGENWPPLRSRYLDTKVKAGYPADPLIKTGAMKNSFKSLAKTDYGEVWNSAWYFGFHQSNQPRSKLPRRVMMKLAEEQKQMIVKIFHTYWFKKIKNA